MLHAGSVLGAHQGTSHSRGAYPGEVMLEIHFKEGQDYQDRGRRDPRVQGNTGTQRRKCRTGVREVGTLQQRQAEAQGHLFQIHFERYWTLNAEARDGFLENCFLKILHTCSPTGVLRQAFLALSLK